MISKGIVFVLMGLSCAVCGRAETSPEAFVLAQLGVVPEEQRLELHEDARKEAAALLGTRRYATSVVYWQNDGKTVWILKARGKFDSIEAGFVIEQGKITGSGVLSMKEVRGAQIASERFLKQLTGLFLMDNGKPSGRIDGISGATMSSSAMRKMTHLALYLNSLL